MSDKNDVCNIADHSPLLFVGCKRLFLQERKWTTKSLISGTTPPVLLALTASPPTPHGLNGCGG